MGAHSCITDNKTIDTLVDEGTHKENPTITPHIHIAHPTPCWLASCPITTHDIAICNLHACIKKEHISREYSSTKKQTSMLTNEYQTIKWTTNFWKTECVTDAQITQTLNLDMLDTWKTIEKIPYGPSHTKVPIAHLLSTCKIPHITGLGPVYTMVEKSTGHEKWGVSQLWLVENATLDQWVFTLGEENNVGEFSHGW